LLDHGRKVLRKSGDDDPLSDKDSEEIGKKKLDDEPEAAAVARRGRRVRARIRRRHQAISKIEVMERL
jgi:hypothetical protein